MTILVVNIHDSQFTRGLGDCLGRCFGKGFAYHLWNAVLREGVGMAGMLGKGDRVTRTYLSTRMLETIVNRRSVGTQSIIVVCIPSLIQTHVPFSGTKTRARRGGNRRARVRGIDEG
jgi:hypothetical protein